MTWVENDKKMERIATLEEVVNVQQEWLDIAQKHLSTMQKKSKMIAWDCNEKDEQFEKLGGFCQESKRNHKTDCKLVVKKLHIWGHW